LYVVDDPGFRLHLLLEEGEPLDQVCNVDGWIDVPGDGTWAATFFTVAEVGRLMARWDETGESAGGAYFVSIDGVILREPGVESILAAVRDLVAEGNYGLYLIRSEG
jgi:hypothetical protein